MKLVLPPLPYDADSLEPYISVETIKFHYLKHHQGYVNKAKSLTKNTLLEKMSVEEIIDTTRNNPDTKNIYNAAAQIWNHDLYWNSMKKNGGGRPTAAFEQQIIKDFSSFDEFCKKIKECGLNQFGSGYVWVLFENNQLEITSATDAEIPTDKLENILLNIDVWEHSYYIDYKNERAKYLQNFLDHLINWDNISQRYIVALY